MPADVLFWSLPAGPGSELAPADPRPGLRRLVTAAGLAGVARPGERWPLKVTLGAPGRPAAVAPGWAHEVAATLCGAGPGPLPAGPCATDTISIATRGLDTADGLRAVARAKGFAVAVPDSPAGTGGGLPFIVGDDPAVGPAGMPAPSPGGGEPAAAAAAVLAGSAGLAVLGPLRPHPHLGVSGCLAALGLDLTDHRARLAMHGGIRPRVDTPLCAGCGSCLDVCLYDAIVIRGGRAVIDHRHCTGCGECMGVCFMAGIAPEAVAGVEAFQGQVAAAAAATAKSVGAGGRPVLYLNLLIQMEPAGPRAGSRRRLPLAGIGILASRDPVACDAAALTLLAGRLGGPLEAWSGYAQSPWRLVELAEAAGLGSREHTVREV